MAITDKRGINITSGFKLISPTPIDARFVVENEEELQSIIENGATYDGLEVWVKSLNSKVRYNGEKFVSTSDLGIEKVEREKEVVDEDFFKDTVVPTNEGTTVPNSGTIEKVYFNTNLTVEEVNALLSQLTYKSDATDSWYHVVMNGVAYIIIYKFSDSEYGIMNMATGTLYYNNGWQSFTNPVQINVENQTEFTENDKLSTLFSITPFEKIERNYIYKGEVVPTGEYIEKVYINKNLTPQEVEKVLSKLSFEKSLLTGTYIVTEWNLTSDTSEGLAVMDVSLIFPEAGISGYVISKGLSGDTIYYISNQDVLDGMNSMLGTNYDFVGWNPNIDDFLEINCLANDTTSIHEYQNDKLSSLFSITPFEKVLKEDLEIVEDGTTVPNSGYVENVYVNTNLSVEEVNKLILNNVKNERDNSSVFVSYFIADESHAYLCAIIDSANKKLSLLSTDGDANSILYISEENPDTDFVGWNPNFNGQITINSDLVSTFGLYNVGTFNSLLSSLISLTPFKGIKGGQIKHETIQFHPISKETGGLDPSIKLFPRVKVGDLRTEGNQKYHISNVTFGKKEISIEGNEEWVGTAVPNSGTIENVYFNTQLSINEVVSLVEESNLTYLPSNGMWYIPLVTENNGLFILVYTEGTVRITDFSTNIVYFTSSKTIGDETYEFEGWKPDFNGEIEINAEAQTDSNLGQENGLENDKLSSLISTTPFEKKKEIFTKVEQGLFHINRDGTPNFEKPVYLKYDISSTKTPVPNSGYVEKISFDTSLSIEEMENIVNSLDNWFDMDGMPVKFIVYNETSKVMIVLAKVPGVGCGILAGTEAGEMPIFSSSLELSQQFGFDAVGWHEDFTGEIECNCEVCDIAELSSAIDNESLVDIVFVGSGGNGLALKLDDINSKQKGKKITSIIYNGVNYAIGEENSIGFEEVD